jgi:hypothetical protein
VAEPVTALAVAVDIRHERGELVVSHDTSRAGPALGQVSVGQGYIDIRLPSLVLTPGSYYLSVRFSDAAGPHVYDRVERVAPFVVRAADPTAYRGLVAVEAEFSQPVAQQLPLVKRSLGDRPVADIEALDQTAHQ